jgi:hypothetical protein
MNRRIAAAICFVLFLAILIHQIVFYGVFVDLKDVLHHEFFAFVLLAFGIGLIVSKRLN